MAVQLYVVNPDHLAMWLRAPTASPPNGRPCLLSRRWLGGWPSCRRTARPWVTFSTKPNVVSVEVLKDEAAPSSEGGGS